MHTQRESVRNGSVQWTAPEVLRGQSHDERSDSYSFGMLLHEMLTRRCPYDLVDMTVEQVELGLITCILSRPQIHIHGKDGSLSEAAASAQGSGGKTDLATDSSVSSHYAGDDIAALVQWCWEEIPANRPSMDEIRAELEKLIGKYCDASLHGTSAIMPLTSRKVVSTASMVDARALLAARQGAGGTIASADGGFEYPAETGRERIGHQLRVAGVSNYRDVSPGQLKKAS